MIFPIALLAFGALALALLFEEASIWFSRQALAAADEEENVPVSIATARTAREARLAGRLMAGTGFVLLVVLARRTGSAPVGFAVAAGSIVWSIAMASLAPVRWQSPLALAGRALFTPIAAVGRLLHRVLHLGTRLPGLGEMISALDRVRQLDEEHGWLTGTRDQEDEDRKILASLHEFGTSRVEDVMVRREEVVGIPAEATLADIHAIVGQEGHSRYPVYRESLDGVVGVLHAFDLLHADPSATASTLARPALVTPHTKAVDALLRELQASYNQMAIVVDEFGGTAGVVTVEDLLEALVGDIEDEYDEPEPLYRKLEPGVFWVEGSARVDEINEALDLDLAEGDYDTVAGLVIERLERIPRPGERIRENGVSIEVAAAEPHRVQAVRIVVAVRPPGE